MLHSKILDMPLHAHAYALAAALLAASGTTQAGWRNAPPIDAARAHHTTTEYTSAGYTTMMVAGGNAGTDANPIPIGSTRILRVTGNAWENGPGLPSARYGHTMTRVVRNGVDYLLLVGGRESLSNDPVGSHTYMAASSGFVPTAAPMLTPRSHHTATLLQDGTVLVVGGRGGTATSAEALVAAETYDAATGTWTYSPGLPLARHSHTATLLEDGRVLVVGGQDSNNQPSYTAWLRDPASGAWTAVSMPTSAARTGHTATLLSNGRVLVAGGTSSATGSTALGSTYLFNPADNTWSRGPELHEPRHSHAAALLRGQVVLTGGSRGGTDVLPLTESIDPANLQSSRQMGMGQRRAGHTFSMSAFSGEALVLGGYDDSGMPTSTAAAWYVHRLPMAPVIDQVQAGDTQATVEWITPSSSDPAVPAVVRFAVFATRQDYPGGAGRRACFVDAPATSCQVQNLANGVTYDFTVNAQAGDGSSATSRAFVATPQAPSGGPPHVPTDLAATAGNGRVTLAWVAPASGPVPTTYTVTAQPGGRTCTAAHPITTCAVDGLTNGTAYTFTATATGARGTSSVSNSASATPSAIPPASSPGVPSGLAATAGDRQVSLSWQASAGNPVPERYTVHAQPGGGSCLARHPATNCTVGNLTNGTAYRFTVSATAASGDTSAQSPEVTAMPQGAGPGGVQAVPVLGMPALALLGLGAAALGANRLRRRHT